MAKILVVEDTHLTYQLLYFILQRDKHSVVQACDGEEALEHLNKNQVHLIITDLHMPVMDGFCLLEKIRSDDRLRHLPVIVLTASGIDHVEELAFEKGATAFLHQPFSSQELKKVVTDCLELQHLNS